MNRLVLLTALVAVTPACKGDAKPTAGTAAGTAAKAGGTPTPPPAASAPFSTSHADAIAALTWGDAKAEVLNRGDTSIMVAVEPVGTPRRVNQFLAGRCLNCQPMQLAAWANAADQYLPPEFREQPDTIWEVKEAVIAGETVITLYEAAVLAKTEQEVRNRHAFTIHWNNGVNQIRISAKDGSMPTAGPVAQMVERVTKAELERQARETFTRLRPLL